MMAASILARQYAILGSEREAIDAWTRIADNGGVVVWTATLYDVDYKSYFLMSFGRDAIRIYRMGQFTGSIDRHLGYAKFPEPGEVAFYEAAAGCPSLSVKPVTTIPWSQVKELRSGNWVLWFKLAKPVDGDLGSRHQEDARRDQSEPARGNRRGEIPGRAESRLRSGVG